MHIFKRDKRNSVYYGVIFGIISAMFFALQHPFSKPASDTTSGNLANLITLLIISEVALIFFAIILGIIFQRIRKAFFEILKDKSALFWVFRLSLIGTASLSIYIYSLGLVNPVFFSIILNTYAIWSLFIGYIWFNRRDEVNREDVPNGILIFGALALGIILAFGGSQQSIPWIGLIISLVPILYAFTSYLRYRHFIKYGAAEFVIAINIIDGPIFVALGLLVLWLGLGFESVDLALDYKVILFVIGVFASTVGSIILMKGMEKVPGRTWIPPFMLFLVPSFVLIYSIVLGVFIKESPNISYEQLFLLALYSIMIVIFNMYEIKSKENQ